MARTIASIDDQLARFRRVTPANHFDPPSRLEVLVVLEEMLDLLPLFASASSTTAKTIVGRVLLDGIRQLSV